MLKRRLMLIFKLFKMEEKKKTLRSVRLIHAVSHHHSRLTSLNGRKKFQLNGWQKTNLLLNKRRLRLSQLLIKLLCNNLLVEVISRTHHLQNSLWMSSKPVFQRVSTLRKKNIIFRKTISRLYSTWTTKLGKASRSGREKTSRRKLVFSDHFLNSLILVFAFT